MEAPDTAPAPPRRRWPRRLAIGTLVLAGVLGAAYWYGGRETTLQSLVQRVARASGGQVVVTGVTGSLYGAMHMQHVEYRTPLRIVTADQVDIDWSPWQYLSSGIAVNALHVKSMSIRTLGSAPPSPLPLSLAPPFALHVADARIDQLTLAGADGAQSVTGIHFALDGDSRRWELRDAAADTPWGHLTAAGRIGARRPFPLDAHASLAQSHPRAGTDPALLTLTVDGDLKATGVKAHGVAGPASGDATLALSPFEAIPLRSLALSAHGIDPGFFKPGLPRANVAVDMQAAIDAGRNVRGSLAVRNEGPAGPLDQERLPLKSVQGRLGGTLALLRVDALAIDLGAAGHLAGSGAVAAAAGQAGIGSANFALRTEGIDLKGLYGKLKTTQIRGAVNVASTAQGQELRAALHDGSLGLDAHATLAGGLLRIDEARIGAGSSIVTVQGEARLGGSGAEGHAFDLGATASHFNPAAFGDLPAADINARASARGTFAPSPHAALAFQVAPSRLFGQALSGHGQLQATPQRLSAIDAALALGANTATLRGNFGAHGDKLAWTLHAHDLAALKPGLYGTVDAGGVAGGAFAAPRTTFDADASGLGWSAAARKNNQGVLHASGEAWLDGRALQARASGTAQHVDPASFGSPLAGSVNGKFDATFHGGAAWQAGANMVLADSTLGSAPAWGRIHFSADRTHVGDTDIDLHLGPNVVAAKGSFGAGPDRLEWRIDAPQLAALGPGFAGALRGNGILSGTMEAPAVNGTLDGANLRAFDQQVRALHATASLGAGHGAADPVASDISVTDYSNGKSTLIGARLQTSGTRGAHTLQLTARNEQMDLTAGIRGGWSGNTWNGTITALQNRGRNAFTLQTPVAVSVGVAAGKGVFGLAHPERIAVENAVIGLPAGSITIRTLDKSGPRWRSSGAAAGVPLSWIAQFSDSLRENLGGDLTVGADWALDLQTAAATGSTPALAGSAHLFRERGDVVAGAEVPVQLGLSALDLRADVAANALRLQARVEGTRAGRTRVDATMQLVGGRVTNDSPLRLTANADMPSIAWLAPLSGQPGLELDGALKLALNGSGEVGAPTLNGSVTGDALAVRWPDQGVKLRNGILRAQLAGDQLVLQQFAFDGPQGHASADGAIRFAGGEAVLQAKLVADHLEVLSRPDRTAVVTGQASVVRDAHKFEVTGRMRADRANLELAPLDRPTLSDDVVVLGRTPKATQPRERGGVPLTADLDLDLGDNFYLKGMGLDAQLAGAAHVHLADRKPPRVTGTIRALNGTYAAYGQHLAVERAVITFAGAYDNPSLNILAVRKRPEGEPLSETNVEAGVEVRGTALAPAARLVSTPNVSDSDKLAWLVLGHGMDATAGNEMGVLSAAAGALLGGSGGGIQSRLANSLHVDEFGLSQAKGLESTVLTVGKRLSQRAYLTFEQGAGTATTLVKLRYHLNPRITLQLQTGANTAFDVLYSWTFD
ncbi:MAG: translocation/assembly module TamB domain-containing protein [Telluria sp.]